MVKINYCPSCGNELFKGSFICPSCNLDIEELFGKGYLLVSNDENNSIELFDGNINDLAVNDIEEDILIDQNIDVNQGDEIVIVVPENADEDEIVIDLDKLGIDVGNLDEEVNIIIQVEGSDEFEGDAFDVEEFIEVPNEWFFDDDPYGIVYYEFVNDYEDD